MSEVQRAEPGLSGSRGRVALYATCVVDLFRPAVGLAAAELLEAAGYTVEVPPQSCCGQVAWNSGEPDRARELAWQVVTTCDDYDYTVLPSGSCAGMLVHCYPRLFAGDPRLLRVEAFCARVHELTRFLVEVADYHPAGSGLWRGRRATYHDSCAGLRELGIREQPRRLLADAGVSVAEMQDTEVCCGFGGTFCVKFPEVSNRMVADKLDNALASGADLLLGGDLSCLLNIAGKAARRGVTLETRHVTEVLVGGQPVPAIAAPAGEPGRAERD